MMADIEVRGNFTQQSDIDRFYSQIDTLDARVSVYEENCTHEDNQLLQYMGTTATVKDMVRTGCYRFTGSWNLTLS